MFEEEKRYYKLKTSNTKAPDLILIAEDSSKKLRVRDNILDAVLVELDKAEYIYHLVPSGFSALDSDSVYAIVSVNPTGEITLRNSRETSATLEKLSEEEIRALKSAAKKS